ncbi:DUF368 domain-containing protein [Thermobifida alba]|uniref:DUF368 domain-containing protein n=1 Tax=Thermobifida alba TaxID=53522 RepID=A0ABY4L1A3_THEAE|nr:DUF368 domain-containing protein [Thermobifida alba]UPT21463.1 DUF368 domain-containing protein [Thermobifida alba]
MAKSIGTHLLNGVRGALIGTAEVVPGISGGTIALITGVYETLINSAGHVVSGVRLLATDLVRGRGTARAREEFGRADWGVVLVVLAGMVLAVLIAARVIAPLVEDHPSESYALFFGLVLASLWVPYSGSGRRWRIGDYLLALVMAVASFLLTGLPPTQVEPTPLVVMVAASVAICALVLPGMSGSFILLTLGLYTVTMNALNDRDLGYIATFALGATIGLALFVKLLQWLLDRFHHLTLVVMTGLMAGSLRSLWPWQDEDRTLLAPDQGNLVLCVVLAVVGAAAVIGIMLVEHRLKARAAAQEAPAPAAPARRPQENDEVVG